MSIPASLPVRHILLTYVATPWEEKVLLLVARFARAMRAKLTVIHVVQIPPRQPVDAPDPEALEQAEEILARAEALAQRERVQIDSDVIQARDAGYAVVETARQLEVDVLVAAGAWSAQHPQLPVGETAAYLLRHAPCPVWLVCEPPGDLPPVDAPLDKGDWNA